MGVAKRSFSPGVMRAGYEKDFSDSEESSSSLFETERPALESALSHETRGFCVASNRQAIFMACEHPDNNKMECKNNSIRRVE